LKLRHKIEIVAVLACAVIALLSLAAYFITGAEWLILPFFVLGAPAASYGLIRFVPPPEAQ
jgi:hypothetical protein